MQDRPAPRPPIPEAPSPRGSPSPSTDPGASHHQTIAESTSNVTSRLPFASRASSFEARSRLRSPMGALKGSSITSLKVAGPLMATPQFSSPAMSGRTVAPAPRSIAALPNRSGPSNATRAPIPGWSILAASSLSPPPKETTGHNRTAAITSLSLMGPPNINPNNSRNTEKATPAPVVQFARSFSKFIGPVVKGRHG